MEELKKDSYSERSSTEIATKIENVVKKNYDRKRKGNRVCLFIFNKNREHPFYLDGKRDVEFCFPKQDWPRLQALQVRK